MKAEVRYYPNVASTIVPEIKELREELEVADKGELVEAAKEVKLPASAEYAHIFTGDEEDPVIGIGRNGIRDFEADEWIVEPKSTRDYIKEAIEDMDDEGHVFHDDGSRDYLYHVEVDGVNIPILDLFAPSGEETILVPKDWNEDVDDIEDAGDIEWVGADEVE